MTRTAFWTEERIVAALQRWAAEFGAPPTSQMWLLMGEWWPNRTQVTRRFGSWNKALVAAGLAPRAASGIGRTRHNGTEAGWRAAHALVAERRGPRRWGKK